MKAFGCLEKILLLQPNSYFGFLREGDIFHLFKRDNEALKSYKKCIEIDEQDGRAQNNMGNVFQKLGQHKEAISFYQSAIKANYAKYQIYENNCANISIFPYCYGFSILLINTCEHFHIVTHFLSY